MILLFSCTTKNKKKQKKNFFKQNKKEKKNCFIVISLCEKTKVHVKCSFKK